VARATLASQIPTAQQTITDLTALGVDLAAVTQQLENEGVKSFSASFEDLMNSLAAKRKVMAAV